MLPGLLDPGGQRDVVVLDVGCNKGYESASFFETLDPASNVTPSAMRDALESVRERLQLGTTPGACDRHPRPVKGAPSPEGRVGSVTVHCLEPSVSNFRGLQALHDMYWRKMPRSRSYWHLHNVVVTNATGPVEFPTACITELCSLAGDAGDPSQAQATWTRIQGTTLDDFAASIGLIEGRAGGGGPEKGQGGGGGAVVVVKMDTEGFDNVALEGARKLLSLHLPAVLFFEYHGKHAWLSTSLKQVTSDLEALGYVCYFDGAPTLTRITGCWWDSLELRGWSNVVCGAAGTQYQQLLESLSFLNRENTA